MNEVAEWLASDEGLDWSWEHFSGEATCYHDMIEITDDTDCDSIANHTSVSSPWKFRDEKDDEPIWADLDWAPDQSP